MQKLKTLLVAVLVMLMMFSGLFVGFFCSFSDLLDVLWILLGMFEPGKYLDEAGCSSFHSFLELGQLNLDSNLEHDFSGQMFYQNLKLSLETNFGMKNCHLLIQNLIQRFWMQ